jgi:predicted nucleotidyltransferase
MYGGKIKKVILYGSYVRGEATKDSDIDILVLVDDSLNPFEVRESLSDLLFDILLEEGELVSVIAIPEHLFESYNSPFMLNVRKEGVVA